jgi:hypothetical protein
MASKRLENVLASLPSELQSRVNKLPCLNGERILFFGGYVCERYFELTIGNKDKVCDLI